MSTTDTSSVRNKLAKKASTVKAPAQGDVPATIADVINSQRAEIARALPKHMDPDRLLRIALTTMRQTPALMECTQESFLGALMLCAQTGLEPGPFGHVYLIPRNIKNKRTGKWDKECQFMLGYKGILELARRSGQITSIEAREVCANDEFNYAYGLDEELVHRPYMGGDRGPIIAVWGLAKFKDGGHYYLVMSRDDIDAAKERSDSGKKGFGPWITDYAAMARKTVIRRMTPYLPLSAEQMNVMAFDEQTTTRVSADIAAEPPAWIDTVAEPEPVLETAPEPDPEPEPEPQPDDQDDQDDGEPEWDEEPPPELVDDSPTEANADGEELMTPAQSKALHALLRKKFDGASGPARFPILSASLSREITSTKQITKTEAGMLIDAYQEMGDGQNDPGVVSDAS